MRAGGLVASYAIAGGSQVQAETTTTAAQGVWNHVLTTVFSNNNRRIWLNGGGFKKDTAPDNQPDPTPVMSFAGVTGEASFFEGRLAEWAVWSGSDSRHMNDVEAGILTAGYSPLCLSHVLHELVHYQPFVRDTNWNSIGPPLTEVGGNTAADHPRIIYPNLADNFIRAEGPPVGGTVRRQGIIPLGLNYER